MVAAAATPLCCRSHSTTSAGGASGDTGSAGLGNVSAAGHGGTRSLASPPSGEASVDSAAGTPSTGATSNATYPDWLTTTSNWQAVDTIAGCRARVARDPQLLPALDFQTCGKGCRAANVAAVDAPAVGLLLGTASRTTPQGTRLALSTSIAGQPPTDLIVEYAYGDGQATAALAVDGACLAQVAGRASPNLWQVFPSRGEATFKLGFREAGSNGTLTWAAKTTTRVLKTFDFASGWGGIEAYSEVFVAKTPTSTELGSVYAKGTSLRPAAAHDAFVAWGEWTGQAGQVVAWSPGAEATVVANGAWFPAFVGVSDKRIAWLGGTGPEASNGSFTEGIVFWCDRPTALGPCQVVEGPHLPINTAGGVISVSDHWISLLGCDAAACDAFVVDTSTRRASRIQRLVDHGIEPLAISETELFVADFSKERRGSAEFERVIRYDLGQLPQIATQL